MNFLALSPAAAYALLLGTGLVIVLLHLLRPPPPRVVIASLLLWTRVRRRHKRPATRWLVLLLSLAAGLSLALALSRPEVPAIGASAQRLVLILDNSPSMSARTRDARSRWQHAIEQARALLERSGTATEVMLMDTTAQLRPTGFLARDEALVALTQAPSGNWRRATFPSAPIGADVPVHLFTDGVGPIEVPHGVIVHSVFEAADNVAVTAFATRAVPQDPTRYEALVQVLNASPSAQRVRLLITGEDAFSLAQDLELKAGETANAILDVSAYPSGVLAAAAIAGQDAFAVDDVAYAVIPPHRAKRILLVTAGNTALEDALRNLPGVRLTVAAAERHASNGDYDALVFDRFAPREPPAVGAVLFRPPPRPWLASHSTVRTHPRITEWSSGHAVTDGIAWSNLRLTRAAVETGMDAGEGLVLTSSGASVVSAGHAAARWVNVGFALQDSNFPSQPDLPVFLGNAVRWVTEPVPVVSGGLGSIEAPFPAADVVDGNGVAVATAETARGVVFEAPQPDVYTLSGPSGRALVVAALPDPRLAQINRSRLSATEATDATENATPHWWGLELWMVLLLLAAVLLVVEWITFVRRLPV